MSLLLRILYRYQQRCLRYCCDFEQDFNNEDISRLKGKHEALQASREALGKSENDGEDFIPLDGKVPDRKCTMTFCVSKAL